MVRSERSQLVVVEPATSSGLDGVNVADHEMIELDVRYVPLFVAYPSEPSVSVNVAAAAPLHVPLLYRLNTTVPWTAVPPAVVTVALSCGSQLWLVVIVDVSFTRKHSVVSFV
jgi:hypothetical protein